MTDIDIYKVLDRIANALDRIAPPPAPDNDLSAADAFVWHADRSWLEPVPKVNRVEMDLLCGIDSQVQQLSDNTRRFAGGLPANNALARPGCQLCPPFRRPGG